MCVYVYICVCVYMCESLCVYIYVCECVYIYIYSWGAVFHLSMFD